MVEQPPSKGRQPLPSLPPYRATVASIDRDEHGLVVHLVSTSRKRIRRMARPSNISVERIPRKKE